MRIAPVLRVLVGGAAAGLAGISTGDAAGAPANPLDDAFSVEGALAEVPAEAVQAETVQIAIGDLDAVSAANGVERPASGDVDEVGHWLLAITTPSREEGQAWPPGVVILPQMLLELAEIEAFDDAVGWNVADVATFVDVAAPPERFTVVHGEFDADTLPSDLVPVEGVDGVVTLGEGDDLEQDLAEATPLSRVGVPQRLAERDGAVVVTPITDFAEEWLAGVEDAAADDPALAAVAGALDDADVASAVLVRLPPGSPLLADGRSPTPEEYEARLEELDGMLVDDPVDVVGMGWGVDDDGGSEITVAYHFADDEAAEGAVDAVEAIYREGASLQSSRPISDLVELHDVGTDGSLVVVTLSPGPEGSPQTIWQMLSVRDLPFAFAG